MKLNYHGQEICLPDFMIIGAAKSGTSSLCSYLASHPGIGICEPKEPNFFSFYGHQHLYEDQSDLARKIELLNYDFDEYQELFCAMNQNMVGEASTGYVYYADSVIENIKELYGDRVEQLKLILLLRNPVDKVFSHYQMFVKWGVEKRGFSKVIDDELAGELDSNTPTYLDFALYSQKLSRFQEEFGRQLKVYLYDELRDEQSRVVDDCLRFLGGYRIQDLPDEILDTKQNVGGIPAGRSGRLIYRTLVRGNRYNRFLGRLMPASIRYHLRDALRSVYQTRLSVKQSLPNADRQRLIDFYQNDIEETARILNFDLSHWLS